MYDVLLRKANERGHVSAMRMILAHRRVVSKTNLLSYFPLSINQSIDHLDENASLLEVNKNRLPKLILEHLSLTIEFEVVELRHVSSWKKAMANDKLIKITNITNC